MAECEFTIGDAPDKQHIAANIVGKYSNLSQNSVEFWISRDDIRVKVNKKHKVGYTIQKLIDGGLGSDKIDKEILALILQHTSRKNIKQIIDIIAKQAEREGYRIARCEVANTMSFLMGTKWERD